MDIQDKFKNMLLLRFVSCQFYIITLHGFLGNVFSSSVG